MFYSRIQALEELKMKKPLTITEKDKIKDPIKIFASEVFGDIQLKEKIPPSSYELFKKAIINGEPLDPNVADQIATAMKEWALQKKATHFTHWFQPLTGLTAEKHDSFISFFGQSYEKTLRMNFSGKQLIKGEPDASSFPHGGIRTTFEARGYTVWDMESPSFIRHGANGSFLCIPSAFASWTGEALDMKTPLLRSNEVLSKSCVRILKLLGDNITTHCYSNLGIEQEFFVIDRGFFNARPDLIACGRTLQGSPPAKGQQLEDHYFGALERRVLAYLQDVEWRLWKLGVPSTTRHNEVAPSQYELAPIFEKVSVACDHNMLTMELLKEVAREHGLACLLHEKPFAGVNGSGKHNNWSISTNQGENIMDPGHNPKENVRFIVFLAGVVRAISLHGDLLRAAISNPGNEHRLGANEAPPAIISIYLGEQLTEAIEEIIAGSEGLENSSKNISTTKTQKIMHLGTSLLPVLPRDASDRNRTSPFAFTGNKFEFRAVGSSQSCARPSMILNTIVAESLNYISEELEKKLINNEKKEEIIAKVVSDIFKEHKKVIFNGNGYSEEWKKEAIEKRKLWHLKTLPEAVKEMSSEKNINLFTKMGVLSKTELLVQQHTLFENFSKTITIEADCLQSMAQTYILPSAMEFKKNFYSFIDSNIQKEYYNNINHLIDTLILSIQNLEKTRQKSKLFSDEDQAFEHSMYCRNELMQSMNEVRIICDLLENIIDDKLWPFPKYSEILLMK